MLRSELSLDVQLGLEYYILDAGGIGGRLREKYEDFIVREISIDGILASEECGNFVSSKEGFLWSVLEKRGIDTVTAVRIIRRFFALAKRDVGIAGLKDTRAVTFQFISFLRDVSEEDVKAFNEKYSRLKLYCFFRQPYYLRPGLLYGNSFSVVIRDVEKPENLGVLLEELKEKKGVPNYYGYQRFGTIRPNTHIVGKYILQGRHEDAVKELLTRVFPAETGKALEARRYLAETWDVKGALEIFPKTLHHERHVLRYLLLHPGDYYGALRSLPIYVRRLFIGAYQAYLFNRVLSRRLERGLSHVYAYPGDVVGLYPDVRAHEPKGMLRVNEAILEKVNSLIDEGRAALMLPVFGYKSELSRGMQGDIEREVLKEEGVDVGDFYIKEMPEASSSGTFRRACLVPENLTAESVGVSDIRMQFSLRKGMYATVLLREFIKPKDLIKQGF